MWFSDIYLYVWFDIAKTFTMTQVLNVLIIDDQQLAIDTYKRALQGLNKTLNHIVFKICTATSYDMAMKKMEEAINVAPYHLIFLDIKVTTVIKGKVLTCEEKGNIIRQFFDGIKIIVSTPFSDNYRINKIFDNVKPDAFLIKEDFSFDNLLEAIKDVLNNTPYYSKTVLKLVHKKLLNNIYLDDIDKQLLWELDRGTKMKDLPNIIYLSLSGIERRKRLLKKKFKAEKQNDEVLIKLVKEYGFL